VTPRQIGDVFAKSARLIPRNAWPGKAGRDRFGKVRNSFPTVSDDLTVAEAADALGTSPQTVRRLLRDGELPGRRQPWGNRFVWVPSRKGVDEFLSQNGRLDGRRRGRAATGELRTVPDITEPRALASPPPSPADARPDRRPWFLRPRGRAALVVVVLGLPLLLFYVSAEILPAALWFDELGQLGVLRGIAGAKVELWLLVAGAAAPLVALNLFVALSRTGVARTRSVTVAVVAASLVAGTSIAASAAGHWQTFLLWRHGQPFGVTDPQSGKDVGFFVFSLPFQLLVAEWLLLLIAVAVVAVALVCLERRALTLRPLRATYEVQTHLAVLAAGFLLVVAWRLRLERFVLELGQPSPSGGGDSFAGAGYVDVHVRSPGLEALSILSVVSALAFVVAPRVGRHGYRRRARLLIGLSAGGLLVALVSVASWLPALVQRFVVDPNPLHSEQPFIERSIAATRGALGIDGIELHPYSSTGRLSAADVSRAHSRLADVQVWDSRVLEARMRDLVTETPYYRPEKPTADIVRVAGRRRLAIGSARELDLRRAGGNRRSWATARLAYTHGLGLPRFSATDIERTGQPRLLDAGLRTGQPRIYFGDFHTRSPGWVLVDTRRPEVDVPGPTGGYHYTGNGGIRLSNGVERAMFALALRSKDLLFSHDVTRHSRILLHREVRDRLATLAPFIHWDAHPAPLTVGGRIVFVVNGYTTSASYPYSERVALGRASVSYARSSVLATVDAFSGQAQLYLTDESDPIARAWAEAFPSLFHGPGAMPAWLRDRARYPTDLFEAQATAYERFHTNRADVFASGSDVWSPPTSLSGSIDVAGDIQFDESDEDDLRRPLSPDYKLTPPPGQTRPRLVLSTNYSPRRGQNLVASLDGWVDDRGRAHLASRVLPPDPITLGPAQVSRFVFSTPRVSQLLGLRNRETRDLNKSSLDSVSLGKPHLLFLPRGIVQIQSLYEGASGPGVSRMIGVTAFLNHGAAVGSDIYDAVRQALHEPPRVEVLKPRGHAVVGTAIGLPFRVQNAQREVMTITSPAGRQVVRRSIEAGVGSVPWIPSAPGRVRVRVAIQGMDGSRTARTTAFRVLSRAPAARVTRAVARARVGRPVRFSFKVRDALSELAQVSTRDGTFTRRYLIRRGTGFVNWTPTTAGPAELTIRVRGRQGQTTSDSRRFTVAPGGRAVASAVTLLHVPDRATVGRRSEISFNVGRSRLVVARIARDGEQTRVWRFARPAGRVAFAWRPTEPGDYRLTVSAQASGGTKTQTTIPLTAGRKR
jgi:excisionase family DNA binding protein